MGDSSGEDSQSDREQRMQFSNDNDFEGGQWIDGEFYFKKQKRGVSQSKDEQLYGVFQGAESSDDQGSDEDGDFRGRKRSRINKKARGMRSRDMTFIPSASIKTAEKDLAYEGGKAADNEQDDSAASAVQNIIKSVVTDAPPAQSGMSNSGFRDLLLQEEKEKNPVASNKKLGAVAVQNLGTWEKHTKGVGRKLLDKFGFKGRLGAKEDGISAAIEVKVRPTSMGLGFGDFAEATSLEANKKLEAELKGEEYIPKKPIKAGVIKPGEGDDTEGYTPEQRAASRAWKKNQKGSQESNLTDRKKNKRNERNVKFQDAMDITKDAPSVVLDMRGPTPKVLTDMKDVNKVDMEVPSADLQPRLGQELLYNVNLMVNMVEIEYNRECGKLKQLGVNSSSLSQQMESLQSQLARDEAKLDGLQKIHLILNRIDKKIEENREDITVVDVFRALKALKSEFPVEYQLLGVSDLIPHICRRLSTDSFGPSWKPLADPKFVFTIFHEWFLRSVELERERSEDPDMEINSDSLDSSLAPSLVKVVESLCLFKIQRFLTTEWSVRTEAEEAVQLIDGLYGRTGVFITFEKYKNMLSNTILPKLRYEVQQWNPTTDNIPVHWWLHPWLPLLKAELSELYPDIRRKIGRALSNWNPADDSALLVLAPWKGVFDESSMENLLQRAIVPKLVTALRSLSVDPQVTTEDDTRLFSAVMAWYKLLPSIHVISLLEGEFFPRWLQVLSHWMASESPDLTEVTQWYLGWKSLVPEQILLEDDVALYFSHALEIMNHWLSGSEGTISILPQGAKPSTGYIEVFERRRQLMYAKKRLVELKQSDTISELLTGSNRSSQLTGSTGLNNISFKDVVEEFAVRNGVTFLPRSDRFHEGKQIYQFGRCSIYIDQGVVFLLKRNNGDGESNWDPVSLEELHQSGVFGSN